MATLLYPCHFSFLLQHPWFLPPSRLQLVPSLWASPTPSPAQPMLLGQGQYLPLPLRGSTLMGVWHQGLEALLALLSTHFECLMPASTPAMSVCPHYSSLELRTPLIHSLSMCKVRKPFSIKVFEFLYVHKWIATSSQMHVLYLIFLEWKMIVSRG